MIDKINVCMCDVCGKIERVEFEFDSHNDLVPVAPDGWSKGANPNMDVCPECSQKLKNVCKNGDRK